MDMNLFRSYLAAATPRTLAMVKHSDPTAEYYKVLMSSREIGRIVPSTSKPGKYQALVSKEWARSVKSTSPLLRGSDSYGYSLGPLFNSYREALDALKQEVSEILK